MTLTYSIARQFTRQTKTGAGSTNYTDVSGVSISSGFFESGKKYLLAISAVLDNDNVNQTAKARLVHGATPTVFDGSEFIDEPDIITGRLAYGYFTVWTANGDDVRLQYAQEISTGNVGATHCVLFALRLSDDFVENTDWFYSGNATSTTLASSDSSSNNAALSFTPSSPGKDWLVLSSAQHQEVSLTISYQSKIVATGTIASSLPRRVEEGEDGGGAGKKCLTMARVYQALGAVAQTFTEVSLLSGAGSGTEARLSSQIFAINVSLLKDVATAYTEAGTDLSGTDYATTVQTLTVTPTALIDTLILGYWSWDPNTVDIGCKARLQVDGADITSGETTDALLLQQPHDARDEIGIFQLNVANLSAASHTVHHDGSAETAAAGRAALYRSLLAAPLTLATAGAGHTSPDFLASPLGFGFGD